jgi:hypothetical protein
MADGSFTTPVSADRDANAVGNPIFVQLSDGTDSALITASGEVNVILGANSGVDIGDVDVTSVIPGTGATNLGKAVDTAGGATDTGVAALVLRDDALTTLTPVDGDYVRLRVDSTGALWTRPTSSGDQSNVVADDSAFTVGTGTLGVIGYLADETTPDSVDEGDVGVPRMTLDRKPLSVLVDATTDSQRLAINASGEAQVDVAAHALTNTNALPVSANNTANSVTNPIFVYSTQDVVSSTEVHDYDTAAAVASDASDNHDYTVTGTTFLLKSVIVSGSGNIKFEIQTGPVAGLSTVAVGFLNGRQGDTRQVNFEPAVEVPVTSTGTVRVIRTNRQGSATDLYSTIIGNDV